MVFTRSRSCGVGCWRRGSGSGDGNATRIANERPDHILHAGDIGELTVLDALGKLASVTAVPVT